MNEVHQLANDGGICRRDVVGHLYIEKRSTRIPTIYHAAQAFLLWTNPLQQPSY
jgi:hypothetical protein